MTGDEPNDLRRQNCFTRFLSIPEISKGSFAGFSFMLLKINQHLLNMYDQKLKLVNLRAEIRIKLDDHIRKIYNNYVLAIRSEAKRIADQNALEEKARLET